MENGVLEILRKHGFGFKKQLGQNFITDKNLLLSIAAEAGVTKEDAVVEIGCGAGTLTCALASRAKKVVAFEIDPSLKPVLEETLFGIQNAEVRFCDFLKCDLSALDGELGKYKVIANIPYYVTTPIILKLLEEGKNCLSVTVMVQEEVAARLCAQAGTPEYGAITANIALYASAKIIKKVPKTVFTPRPNVDSAVVSLIIEPNRLPVEDENLYKRVVKAAFSSRRKTLENNLVNSLSLSRAQARALLSECGIKEGARGETLTPLQFAALSNALKKL